MGVLMLRTSLAPVPMDAYDLCPLCPGLLVVSLYTFVPAIALLPMPSFPGWPNLSHLLCETSLKPPFPGWG